MTVPAHGSRRHAAAIRGPTGETWAKFLRNRSTIAGLVLLAPVLATALVLPALYPVDPFEIVWAPLAPPGAGPTIPLGSDLVGRDVLAGIIHGGRTTLAVGAIAAAIAVVLGIGIGAAAGFYGGLVNDLLMRLTEFFQVLPALLFAMVVVSLFGPGLATVGVAIGIVSWPPVARLTRAEFLRIRQLGYVTASRAVGASDWRLIWRVMLPNALPPVIAASTLAIGAAILFEAGLSFLGLTDPNAMSWGLMMGVNRDFAMDAWWTVMPPGLAVFMTVLGVSLIGDGLNDALDPKVQDPRSAQ